MTIIPRSDYLKMAYKLLGEEWLSSVADGLGPWAKDVHERVSANHHALFAKLQRGPTRVRAPLDVVRFDAERLESLLQPGDILTVQLMKDVPKDHVAVIDKAIAMGQRLSQHWTFGIQEARQSQDIHMALYLGNGQIAESTPGGTLLSDLSHPDWSLRPGDALCYRVTRIKDEHIAEEAVAIAQGCAVRLEEGVHMEHPYSIPLAVNALFHSSAFGFEAKKRLLMAYVMGAPSARSFFCSYFVGWALQRAESEGIIEHLIRVHPELAPPDRPGPSASASKRAAYRKRVNQWAESMVYHHGDALDALQLNFDPKHLSPQRLRGIMLDNTTLFEDVMTVIAPDGACTS